jgi:hypothetical protein
VAAGSRLAPGTRKISPIDPPRLNAGLLIGGHVECKGISNKALSLNDERRTNMLVHRANSIYTVSTPSTPETSPEQQHLSVLQEL